MEFDKDLEYLENDFDLVGRGDECDEIIYRIASGSMLVVQGDKGIGKTALLRYAIDNFKGNGKVVYADVGTFGKRFDVDKLLKGRGKGMILLIDNVEHLSEENNKKIKYFYDQDIIRSVVFTTVNYDAVNFTDSIRSRIGKNFMKIKKLGKAESLEAVKVRLGEDLGAFSKDILDKLFRKSKNLKTLIVNCNFLCELLAKDNRDIVEVEDLDNIIRDVALEKVENCLECSCDLVRVGKHWRCKECDRFCKACGFLFDDGDDKCPKCGSDLEETK